MQNNPRRQRRHLGVSMYALCIGLVTTSASGVVIDNVDPGFTVLSGSWSVSSTTGQWGTNYRYKPTNELAVTGEVEWRPDLAEAGEYKVWVWYRASTTARPNNARYTVHYDGGSQDVYVNQQVNGSRWVELGAYPFAAGTAGHVTLVDQAQAGRTVVADAVRFDIPQIRAFWADVFHYGLQTAEQIDTMIARAVEGNYNVLIPEVLAFHDNEVGSHGAYWRSYVVTRSTYVTEYFDPLTYMVQQAHANGLEIHPWLVAYRASAIWPPAGNAVLEGHPDWLMVPRANMGGGPATVGGYYTFDPGNPEVQEYLVSIVKELVTYYEIDGIHWDYIRYTQADAGYPADANATNSGLARFRRLKGRTDTPAATGDVQWDDFRRRTITELIRRVRAEIPAITANPRQPLRHSASLITWGDAPAEFEGSSAYARFQNWAEWMERGYLDTAVPMCYFREYLADQQQWYRNWVDAAMGWRYSREMVIGPGIYMNAMADSITQLQYARDAGADGFSTYSYDVTSKDGDGPAWYPYVATNLFKSPVGMPIMPWRDSATATEGTLYGQITDYYTGDPVDGATVQVGVLDPVKTDGNGYYVVTMIPATGPGTSYDVFVSAGDDPVVIPNVTIVPGKLQRQDAAVQLGIVLIIDNLDAGFSVLSGSWSTSSGGEQWGSNYRVKGASTSVTGEVEWRPELPETAEYAVSVWYRSVDVPRATDVRYTVHHQGGATDVYVNQQINGGQWFPLGVYTLPAGSSASVTLVDQANSGNVCADAVRFEVGGSVPIEGARLTMAAGPLGIGATVPAVGGPYGYDIGTVVAIEALMEPAYVFDHWEVSSGSDVADPYSPTTTVTIDEHKTVTAVYVPGPPPDTEFRAFWADVFHYGLQTAEQIDTMIARAVEGNYNAIIPEVVAYHDNTSGSHGAYWRSNVMARSPFVTDSFEPLAYMVQQAHANGLEIHPWMVAFRVSTVWPPAGNDYLTAHPECLMVPRASTGTIAKVSGYYTLDPGGAGAQEYLISIVKELVSNYEIDGIHWDYIRYTTKDAGYPADLSYPKSSLARFQAITGRTDVPPSEGDAEWDNFRRRTITELIRRCRAEMAAISNPRQPLRHSASLISWGNAPSTFEGSSAYGIYQNWREWMELGFMDTGIPMMYFREYLADQQQWYRNWVDAAVGWRYDRQMCIGPGVYLNGMVDSVTQLYYARNAGAAGFSTYSYDVTSKDGEGPAWYPYVASNVFSNVASVPPMPWRDPATATEGTLYGRVFDGTTGEPADDATVEVVSVGTVQTDGNGYYVKTLIPAVAAGTAYDVTASKAGAPSETHGGVTVVAGDVRREDLLLGASVVPPMIVEHPAGQTVCPGTTVVFRVSAMGAGTLSYQWQKDDTDLVDGGHCSGAQTPMLTMSSTDAGDAGAYRCIVGNANGNRPSDVADLSLYATTVITSPPVSQWVAWKGTAQLSVSATGEGALSYQWQKDGVDLAEGGHYTGVTSTTLTITGANGDDAADYRCVVTATCGSVASDAATLTVGVRCDFDADADVDLTDFGLLQICFNGPNRPPADNDCEEADLDDDGDIDLADFGLFSGCFNGPNRPPAAGCP